MPTFSKKCNYTQKKGLRRDHGSHSITNNYAGPVLSFSGRSSGALNVKVKVKARYECNTPGLPTINAQVMRQEMNANHFTNGLNFLDPTTPPA
jgi:hypothetical protein